MSYFNDGEIGTEMNYDSVMKGVWIAASIVAVNIIEDLFGAHVDMFNDSVGPLATHSLQQIIYEKSTRISGATNKEYTPGKILDFYHKAGRVHSITHQATRLIRVPLTFIACLYYTITNFGIAFLPGALLIVLGQIMSRRQDKICREEGRVRGQIHHHLNKQLTEGLNSIKTVKLYNMKDLYIKKITDAREAAKVMNIECSKRG
jgi:hypothetical protein